MKKNLLLIAAMAASFGASAQTLYCFAENAGDSGLDGSETIPAGYVVVDCEYGKMETAFDETVKTMAPNRGPYTYITVQGGEAHAITTGYSGNTNGQNPGKLDQNPTGGMTFKLTTTKTGYFTLPIKLNTNKNYWLQEGKNFAAYRLGVGNLAKASGVKFEYTMPVDEYDALDLTSPEIGKYFIQDAETGALSGPKVPWQVYDAGGADMGEGSGFIQFISYASEDAPITFWIWAQGSKIGLNGFIYTPDENPTFANAPAVVFTGVEKTAEDGTVTPAPEPIAFGEIAGVENIAVDQPIVDLNAPVYNIYGQRVSKDTKGLLIQNGVKYYNR